MKRLKQTFGPVISRRFGRSLGVDPFPEKLCTYSCVYCQVGLGKVTLERKPFCDPSSLLDEVLAVKKEYDVITFVPKGEPTLDVNLGACASELKGLKPLVLLTNGSLAYLDEVRKDMSVFDIVSLKLDAASERTWRKVNRPHPSLDFDEVFKGMKAFAGSFEGKLVTETMVLKINEEEMREIAEMVKELDPLVAFLTLPTRPPALPVEPGDLAKAFKAFKDVLGERVVALGKKDNVFLSDDPQELRRVAEVHPVPLKLVKEVPEGCEVVEFSGEKYVRCS